MRIYSYLKITFSDSFNIWIFKKISPYNFCYELYLSKETTGFKNYIFGKTFLYFNFLKNIILQYSTGALTCFAHHENVKTVGVPIKVRALQRIDVHLQSGSEALPNGNWHTSRLKNRRRYVNQHPPLGLGDLLRNFIRCIAIATHLDILDAEAQIRW